MNLISLDKQPRNTINNFTSRASQVNFGNLDTSEGEKSTLRYYACDFRGDGDGYSQLPAEGTEKAEIQVFSTGGGSGGVVVIMM